MYEPLFNPRDLARRWLLELERDEGVSLTSSAFEYWLTDRLEEVVEEEDRRRLLDWDKRYEDGYGDAEEEFRREEKEAAERMERELKEVRKEGWEAGYQEAANELTEQCVKVIELVNEMVRIKEDLARKISPIEQSLRIHKVLYETSV